MVENKKIQKLTLKDICIDSKGSYGIGASAVEYDLNLPTYLRITDINDDGTINYEGLKSVDSPESNKYFLEKNDIVFARTGNSTGKAYFYDERDGKFVYAGFLIKFSLDETKVNPKYVKLYTLSDKYKNWVNSFSTGSTRANINAKGYGDMPLELPDRQTQDYIVNILESLNNKIRINNEMNKTLEEMAQTLFKRWFIDFDFPNENGEPYRSSGGKMVDSELGEIPEGWEAGKLGDLFKFVKGKKPKIVSETFSEETPLKYLTIKGFNGDENLYASEDKTILINKKDIVMVMDGASSGDVYIGKSGVLGSTFSKIEKTKEIDWSYIYLILKYYESDIKSHTTGSAIPHTDKGYVEKIRVPLPNLELLNILSKKISGIIKRKLINQEEIQSLTEIRDTLLPKLMSGEIEV